MTVDYPDRLGRSNDLHLALGPGCLDESLTPAGYVRLRRWIVGAAGIAWVKRALWRTHLVQETTCGAGVGL